MRDPVVGDIEQVCLHYLDVLERFCKQKDSENYQFVRPVIEKVLKEASVLKLVDKKIQKKKDRVEECLEEFKILKHGDLEEDAERTPKSMHDELLKVEGEYAMLMDTVESYRRQVKMLEESLEPGTNKKAF